MPVFIGGGVHHSCGWIIPSSALANDKGSACQIMPVTASLTGRFWQNWNRKAHVGVPTGALGIISFAGAG